MSEVFKGEQASTVERQNWLVMRTRALGFVQTDDLAAELGVSTMTIRRDLQELAKRRQLRRVRGGAVPYREGGAPGTGPSLHATGDAAAADRPIVGLVVPDLGYHYPAATPPPDLSYYFEKVIKGARNEVDRLNLQARLVFSAGRQEPDADDRAIESHERQVITDLVAAGVAGVLFTPNASMPQFQDRYASWLAGLPIPVVLVERELLNHRPISVSSVRTSHELGAELAVQHLIDLGHRRIALLVHHHSQTARALSKGWLLATAEDRVDHSRTDNIADLNRWPDPETIAAYINSLTDDGITALVCHNDANTYHLLQFAAERGLKVPTDLSIVGYDDDFAGLMDPPLTAVSPPREAVGRHAVRLLADQLNHPGNHPACHLQVEPQLIIRQSTVPIR